MVLRLHRLGDRRVDGLEELLAGEAEAVLPGAVQQAVLPLEAGEPLQQLDRLFLQDLRQERRVEAGADDGCQLQCLALLVVQGSQLERNQVAHRRRQGDLGQLALQLEAGIDHLEAAGVLEIGEGLHRDQRPALALGVQCGREGPDGSLVDHDVADDLLGLGP